MGAERDPGSPAGDGQGPALLHRRRRRSGQVDVLAPPGVAYRVAGQVTGRSRSTQEHPETNHLVTVRGTVLVKSIGVRRIVR
jgi:hypothetical protein